MVVPLYKMAGGVLTTPLYNITHSMTESNREHGAGREPGARRDDYTLILNSE
jgi:hypothetical protein